MTSGVYQSGRCFKNPWNTPRATSQQFPILPEDQKFYLPFVYSCFGYAGRCFFQILGLFTVDAVTLLEVFVATLASQVHACLPVRVCLHFKITDHTHTKLADNTQCATTLTRKCSQIQIILPSLIAGSIELEIVLIDYTI